MTDTAPVFAAWVVAWRVGQGVTSAAAVVLLHAVATAGLNAVQAVVVLGYAIALLLGVLVAEAVFVRPVQRRAGSKAQVMEVPEEDPRGEADG